MAASLTAGRGPPSSRSLLEEGLLLEHCSQAQHSGRYGHSAPSCLIRQVRHAGWLALGAVACCCVHPHNSPAQEEAQHMLPQQHIAEGPAPQHQATGCRQGAAACCCRGAGARRLCTQVQGCRLLQCLVQC
eukprot:CAMPEP_0202904552 /NCGR_PEP_ID=MMETSP1392-20130828/29965_1 /ASSEMBLY_ACC=CAM_ASM_000868 /TAXON_ID=225041 /ORGANISM="Chlamydomonas chlamydogama, Strain SAG 11-48b" /LENGTH=130 /DNA_ID=CAMNT_0049592219 /DNA_START=780 /DNA_END=1172 /DNA_ORIENTATION=+